MLGQGYEFGDYFLGKFGARRGWPIWREISGAEGNAQDYIIAVYHENVRFPLLRRTDGQHCKLTTEQWLGRVDNLDLGYFFRLWVLERGIKLLVRSTRSIMSA